MIKKNKRLKMGFLEKDLLINNFYSETDSSKPKNVIARFMAFGFLLVVALVSGIGILSMLAAPGDQINIGVSANILPLPTATVSANPNPIPDNSTTSLLSWSSTDALSCTASDDWSGAQPTSGTQSIGPLSSAKTYTITCSGPGGTSIPASVTVTVTPPPPPTVSPPTPTITSFTATPSSVNSGASSELDWTSSNTASCTASTTFDATDWSGSVPVNSTPGFYIVMPPSTPGSYIYSLNCNGASASVVVNVSAPPTVSLNSDKTGVTGGGTATLTWSTTNATSCTASTTFGATDWNNSSTISIPNGSLDVALPDTPSSYVYTLTCNGVSKSVSIDVALPPSIIDFSSDKTNVGLGGSAGLSWQATNASSCYASNIFGATDWIGTLDLVGQADITLPNSEGDYQYVLTCQNAFGSASKTVSINASNVTPITNPITPEEGPSYTTFGSPGGIEVTVALSDDEVAVDYLGQISFIWKSTGADSCTASGVPGWSGDKAVLGNEPLQNPGQIGDYTYVLTCENVYGQKTTAFAKLSIIESSKIEGLMNIIERELTSPSTAGQNQTETQVVAAPISDVLDKTGIIQAFSVSSKKSPLQNTVSALVLLAIAGLIGMGIFSFYLSRKNWGLVFNSQNNLPITDAKIELRKSANDQILQTILTDHKGRFRFRMSDLKDGEYHVNVSKIDYSFPSRLFSKKITGVDKNIYMGKDVKLIKKNGLRLKIPVDPALIK